MQERSRKKTYLNRFYSTEDFYKYYRNTEFSHEPYKVTKELYKKILFDFNLAVQDVVINKGLNVKLPYGLGTWKIVKFKHKFKKTRMDYAHYNKTGQWIPHINYHSDNFIAKWFWEKKKLRITNSYYYAFTPCNTSCKMLAKNMKEFKGQNRFLSKLIIRTNMT